MRTDPRQMLSGMSYPVLIAAAIGAPLTMMGSGLSVFASTCIPAVAAALAVSLLELCNPERTDWKPARKDVFNDTLFMAIVQLVVPKAVGFLILIAVARSLPESGLDMLRVWPSHWPVPAQFLLMVLLADFFRYWLHRGAHGIPWLWAFHAVHHAPRVLYWWNVGRFHPVDKGLQICLDSVPFILVGVTEPVLAVYFVFYATNGFLQHSNIHLWHGPLNYVFSTAELHRWHHARDGRVAHCNFGNNLIVWDLLFGTWYLPKGRQVQIIGIRDESYPVDFLGLMKAPFYRLAESHSPSNPVDVPIHDRSRESTQ